MHQEEKSSDAIIWKPQNLVNVLTRAALQEERPLKKLQLLFGRRFPLYIGTDSFPHFLFDRTTFSGFPIGVEFQFEEQENHRL